MRRPAWWALLHWTVAGIMPMMTFLAARRPLVAAAFALTGLVMVVGGSFVRALENRSAWFLVAGTGLPCLMSPGGSAAARARSARPRRTAPAATPSATHAR